IYSSITATVRSDRKYYVVLALYDDSYMSRQVDIRLDVISEHPAPLADWRVPSTSICSNPDINLGVLDSFAPIVVLPNNVSRAFLTTDGREIPRDTTTLTVCAKERTDK